MASSKKQQPPKVTLDRARLWVDRTALAWGLWQFTCHAYESAYPVGFAWANLWGAGQAKVTSADIRWIETLPRFRHNGVASAILVGIFDFPVDLCRTTNGSADGGLPWLKAMGFVLDQEAGVWRLANRDFLAIHKGPQT